MGLAQSDQQTLNLISQRLSRLGVEAYGKCLENILSPGLRIWLDHRADDFFILAATWVGGDEKVAVGRYDQPPTITNGGTIVEQPAEWVRGKRHEIIIQKAPAATALLRVSVGGQPRTFIALRDIQPRPIGSRTVLGNPQTASSGGPGANKHKVYCQPQAKESCVRPEHPQGYLVLGSGDSAETVRIGSDANVQWELSKNTTAEVCITYKSKTTACEVNQSISGRARAVERHPTN
jgi:hypothetical protein